MANYQRVHLSPLHPSSTGQEDSVGTTTTHTYGGSDVSVHHDSKNKIKHARSGRARTRNQCRFRCGEGVGFF